MRECSVRGCECKHYARGFCKKHHQWRWKRGLLPAKESEMQRFWAKVARRGDDDCWEWTGGRDSSGYGNFHANGELRAHRFSYKLHFGKIEDGAHILHKCNNKGCVNPRHLKAGTHQENMQDMAASGVQKGTRQKHAVISERISSKILDMLLAGKKQRDVAEEFGICRAVVASVASGASWGWVDGNKEKVEAYRKMDKSANLQSPPPNYNDRNFHNRRMMK